MFKIMKKCSIEDINEKLEYLKAHSRIIVNIEPTEEDLIGGFKAFLYKKITVVHLVYKDLKNRGRVIEYSAHLDREFDGNEKNGAQAFAILQRYYKAPEVNNKDDAPFSKGISPYRNRKYYGKRISGCYGYDLNSAYPFGMLQDLPDTTQPLPPGEVGEDEYSFKIGTDFRAKPGDYAKYRFKIMPSPYQDFVQKWYNKKATAKNEAEKTTAKFVMNAAIGALQNHNCYLRAAIMNNFQEFIIEIFKKYKNHILSMNTDSIVSDIRIPEIEANLGNGIGQWKIEHYGDFAIHKNGFSVQWNREIPAFGAGISKSRFNDGYDILVDDIPPVNNIYDIDYKAQLVVRRRDYASI